MKNFLVLLLLFVGLAACSTAPPDIGHPEKDTTVQLATDLNLTPMGTVSTANQAMCATYVLKALEKPAGDKVILNAREKAHANFRYVSYPVDIEDPPEIEEGESLKDYLLRNWEWALGILILAIEAVVRITPTQKDNTIVTRLLFFVGKIFPNKMKGGGTHATPG